MRTRPTRTTVRIATRRSALALYQARAVQQALHNAHAGLRSEILALQTRGDEEGVQAEALGPQGVKGLFTQELESALREDRAQLAVHSLKDLPAQLAPEMELGAVLRRGDPRDALLTHQAASLETLPQGARVGTASLRRRCQLLACRPDLRILPLRGNVDTRLRKLREGRYDAIVLAAAGLQRLALDAHIRSFLAPQLSLPAPGQGAIGIEIHRDNSSMRQLLRVLHDSSSALCIAAERAMCRRLNSDCRVPVGGLAHSAAGSPDRLVLRGLVGAPDGGRIISAQHSDSVRRPEQLGIRVAEALLEQGAAAILQAARS